jgi:hypothetical protein
VYGRPRFLAEPLGLPSAFVERIYRFSQTIGALYDELSRIVWDDPKLLDSLYALTHEEWEHLVRLTH